MISGQKSIPIQRIRNHGLAEQQDIVAIEEPLEIRIHQNGNSQPVSITMRTPGADEELACGFLFTEGILRQQAELESVRITGLNEVTVTLAAGTTCDLDSLDRNFYTTSSCGVCGKSSIEAIYQNPDLPASENTLTIPENLLFSLIPQLNKTQTLFSLTGGIHAAALFDASGNLLSLQEDVGRHNALDKLIGEAFLKGSLPLSECLLLLSGRASFELIQKASMAGIPIVSAIGAPSSLAVELAQERGQILIGFLKASGYNCYSGHERIHR